MKDIFGVKRFLAALVKAIAMNSGLRRKWEVSKSPEERNSFRDFYFSLYCISFFFFLAGTGV
jgi:hypothetical protein